MLSKHKTQLRYDDYTSAPIEINNGTMQGCPFSMLIYTFYHADLIDIARGKNKLSTGFVDDCAFVAVGNSVEETRQMLKDTMERPGRGLAWSQDHNSPFKLSKLACMDFTHPNTTSAISCLLSITTNHVNSTMSMNKITTAQSYKYLGVIFNPKLNWKAHINKVLAKVT